MIRVFLIVAFLVYTKYSILSPTNERVTRHVTWRVQLITAVIQVLFKSGGRISYLGRYICHILEPQNMSKQNDRLHKDYILALILTELEGFFFVNKKIGDVSPPAA